MWDLYEKLGYARVGEIRNGFDVLFKDYEIIVFFI